MIPLLMVRPGQQSALYLFRKILPLRIISSDQFRLLGTEFQSEQELYKCSI